MASLDALLDFIKSVSLHPACKPGFARVLQVSHSFLSSANVSIHHCHSDGTATTKPILRYHGKQQQNTSVVSTTGMLFAILDEMTTNVTFLHGCPMPPGASIHIRLELAAGSHRYWRHNQDYVMDSSVIKSGKTICFTDCNIYDDTNRRNLIAYGSQVKYLPTGSWLTDVLFSSPLLWNLLVHAYIRRTNPPSFPNVGSVHEYLIPEEESSSQSLGRAIFRVTPYVTNAFGALHGGAQGMMMEIVGAKLAKAILKTDSVTLTSIQVDFQSSGRDHVEVTAQELDVFDDTAQFVVRMVATKTGRIVSTGTLRFVKSSSMTTDDNGPISRL